MPVAANTIAVDASVAIPLVLRYHEAHGAATAWKDNRTLSLCGPAWIETYAVLTRLPGTARLLPEDAATLLTANFSRPLSPKPATLAKAVDLFAASGVAGGATYDGWVALAALDNHTMLASRDARAEATYRRLGLQVEMII